MAITVTSLTVLPTARPWDFAAIGASAGGSVVEVGYNANLTDGSSGGGTGSQNNTFTFGQQHVSPAGETAPHTVAVVPGDSVTITYTTGTVKQDSGATLYGPRGDTSATTGKSPTTDFTDSNGYVNPTDCMPAAKNLSLVNPTIGTVGLCGVFTDGSGNIIANSFWDWKSKGGTDSANSVITLNVPAGAAFLSMGINDTILRDNAGAGFSVTVAVWDSVFAFPISDYNGFTQFPVGQCCVAAVRDYTNLVGVNIKQLVFITTYFTPQTDLGIPLLRGYVGQLFPHGGQQSGGSPAGVGQNFPR